MSQNISYTYNYCFCDLEGNLWLNVMIHFINILWICTGLVFFYYSHIFLFVLVHSSLEKQIQGWLQRKRKMWLLIEVVCNMSSSFVKITFMRRADSHAECELSFQYHSLFGQTHLTTRVVFTRGDECDWLMGRWSPSPPPWLAFSFWQNTVIMGFSDQQGTIQTLLRFESQGKPPTAVLSGTSETVYTSRCIWQWVKNIITSAHRLMYSFSVTHYCLCIFSRSK